jgi:signal transduction histidine kinase
MRKRFSQLPLARQFVLVGVVTGALLVLLWLLALRWLSGWFIDNPGAAARALIFAALTLVIPLLGLAFLGRRLLQAQMRIALAANRIQREEQETPIPLAETDSSTRHMSMAVRRMVDALFGRIGALTAKNARLEQSVQDRTLELDTIAEVSRQLAAGNDESELQSAMLAALEQAIDYRTASMWGRRKDHIALLNYRISTGFAEAAPAQNPIGMRLASADQRTYEEIESTQQPVVVNRGPRGLLEWLVFQLTNEGRTDQLYQEGRSWMAAPLIVHNRVVAVLRVDHNKADYFSPERQRMLMAVGYQAALAMENARLNAQAREAAVFAERSRIARDLHDGVSQSLFASTVIAGTINKMIDREPAQARAQLDELQKLNRRAMGEMRMMLYELQPDALQRMPLKELMQGAVDAATNSLPARFDVQIEIGAEPPANVRMGLYRIAQEALSNVVKHSGAARVQFELACPAADRCLLRIADDGSGMDNVNGKPGHFGLGNMRERAASIGAAIDLRSAQGHGTEITVVWQPDAGDAEEEEQHEH